MELHLGTSASAEQYAIAGPLRDDSCGEYTGGTFVPVKDLTERQGEAAMSFYERSPVRIHYEETGNGFPLVRQIRSFLCGHRPT
jgi:hypothetical protein